MSRPKGSKNKRPRVDKGRSHPKCQVDREVFYESIRMLYRGEVNSYGAAKLCGISQPTWKKWANKLLLGEEVPESFFKDDKSGTD